MIFPDWLRQLPSDQVTYIKGGIDMPNTPTNESNEAYERRIAAGKLLVDAPQGARFEYKRYPDDHNSDLYDPCSADEVFALVVGGGIVRIAPTPKKVLRPVGEILDEANRRKQLTVVQNVVSIIEGGQVWYIADLLTQVVVEQNAPDWFFTEASK